jgi:hypothetical protein
MPNQLPPVDYLHKLLSYDPASGTLRWKHRTPDMFSTTHGKKLRTASHACNQWNKRYAGKEAFTCQYLRGAFIGTINDRQYLAHRVAYALHHGIDPYPLEIDHINGDPADNRAENLRRVTSSEQSKNMPCSRANRSGRVGVFFIARIQRWGASIQVQRKTHWLGYYENQADAVAARQEAEVRLGFHPNHGREPTHGHTRIESLEVDQGQRTAQDLLAAR